MLLQKTCIKVLLFLWCTIQSILHIRLGGGEAQTYLAQQESLEIISESWGNFVNEVNFFRKQTFGKHVLNNFSPNNFEYFQL